MGQVAQLAESPYQAHPDLKGIGGHWDEVTVTAINAPKAWAALWQAAAPVSARIVHRPPSRAKGETGFISGGAECPVEMGQPAFCCPAALLEKEMPYYIGSQTILWNLDNLPEAWGYELWHSFCTTNCKASGCIEK